MNPREKMAWYILAVLLLATVAYFTLLALTENPFASAAAFSLLALIAFSPMFATGKKGKVVADEHDKLISLKAAKIGFQVFWLYFVGYCMFALVFPQGIVDLIRGYGKYGKSYWKHGSRLDEMEKRIFRRARKLSLMAFYGYIGAALLGVMSYYGAIGSDQVPIKLLQTTLLSGIFVLVWSQGVALVVLYSLQGKAAKLLDY